jgi:hypothetical protein
MLTRVLTSTAQHSSTAQQHQEKLQNLGSVVATFITRYNTAQPSTHCGDCGTYILVMQHIQTAQNGKARTHHLDMQ